MITMEIEDKATPALEAVIDEICNDMSPMLDMIGRRVILPSIKRNFDEEGRPTPWQPLAPRTQMERIADGLDPQHPILQRFGELLRSSTEANESANLYDLQEKRLSIKNLLNKAEVLHFGNGRVPARPFFFLPSDDYVLVEKETFDYVNKKLEEIVGREK